MSRTAVPKANTAATGDGTPMSPHARPVIRSPQSRRGPLAHPGGF
jgi:hypothetical protein